MTFREISSWAMAALMSVTGIYYLKMYLAASAALDGATPPFEVVVPYAAFAVSASIVVQIVLAIIEPKDIERSPDERERPLLWRAGHWAGLVQGGLCIVALLAVIHTGDTILLFHLIVGSLIVSQIVEYSLQIAFLRRSA